MGDQPGPLQEVRVLEISQVMAGPYCTMLLADLGADVIKLEPPGGDSTRRMPGAIGDSSPSFWAVNRNKRGIVVDLKSPAGREIVRRLIPTVDVLVENYRPGVMASFGLDYPSLRDLNPGLVYASISAYGQDGPWAARGGFDLVVQGMAGIMSVTGNEGLPPMKSAIPLADLGAALFGAVAILAAHVHRLRTGEGQYIDTSLLDAAVALSVWEATHLWSGRGVPRPMGSAHRMAAPYQAIRCADGYITLGAANQRTWERLAHALGRADLLTRPEFATDAARVAHRAELIALIEEVTAQHPRGFWLERLEASDVPAGPILDYAEVFAHPQVRHRQLAIEVVHPDLGPVEQLGPPVKLSRTPAVLRRPAPGLGEHTREVLIEAGYGPDEVEGLVEEGVVHA